MEQSTCTLESWCQFTSQNTAVRFMTKQWQKKNVNKKQHARLEMLFLSFSCYVIELHSSRLFLLHQMLIFVITVVKSFLIPFWLAQIRSDLFRCFLQFFISGFGHHLCHLHRLHVPSLHCSCHFGRWFIYEFLCCGLLVFFVKVLFSLLLFAAEGASLFYLSVVSFPLAPFQAPLLYVIQVLSDVTVRPNITDTLSEPFLQL